jgi:hypothetical protein
MDAQPTMVARHEKVAFTYSQAMPLSAHFYFILFFKVTDRHCEHLFTCIFTMPPRGKLSLPAPLNLRHDPLTIHLQA